MLLIGKGERSIAGEVHCPGTASEPRHLRTIGTRNVQSARRTDAGRIEIGLQCPIVTEMSIELCLELYTATQEQDSH